MSESAATILIVDDVPANLGVALETLEEQGFCVLVAQDGAEGVKRAEFVRPDLILLDVMMPDMDGFEACRRLKASEATRDIPVIFMTALADTANKLAGFAAGGVDYVTKPFDTAEVVARVNTHLTLRAMQTRLEAQNRQLQREVDERRQAEAALQQTVDQLQRSKQRLQEAHGQLLQAEKMASVGLLAAGVAHEINNPIGFVSSNLKSLETYVAKLLDLIAVYESGEPAWADIARQQFVDVRRAKAVAELDYLREDISALLAESGDGLARVKKIVADLKDFSHVGEPAWQTVDLRQGLDSTLNLVWHELKYKADVRKEYGVVDAVECMPMEVNQVFMNLLVNAGQAIDGKGEIHIRTGQVGEDVWVEITDSGSGIAPEHVDRIFDPFFTTKPVGTGTGLGLALSYATVKKHHGRIEVSSAVGQGTSFRIWLPCRQPGAHAQPA